jgi:hypothetical protein
MGSCEHKDFRADVSVHRLEDTKQFQANVKIECSQCHLPFQFLGLPLGMDLQGAAMSVDGQEARLGIAPVGSVPQPLDGTLLRGFRIKVPGADH